MWYEKEIKVMECSKANQRIAKTSYKYFGTIYNYKNVWCAYDKPSYIKESIWNNCKNFALLNNVDKDINGEPKIYIMSKNTFSFTVGFTFTEKSTGKHAFAYITKDYNRYCYIE